MSCRPVANLLPAIHVPHLLQQPLLHLVQERRRGLLPPQPAESVVHVAQIHVEMLLEQRSQLADLGVAVVHASGGMEAIRSDTTEKAQLLKSLGINTNLAPVADLSGNQQDFIYDRSFGDDPAGVSEFVRVSVETYSENGMACVLKHFPGYGNNGDTHTGLTWDKRPYSEFQTRDFLPFQAGFEVGAPIVLVNHNIVECMDPERPATLSAEVHRVLREELGFGGLIMTDDLEMEAIPQYTAGENPAPQAFLAGNDLLLCSEPGESFHALLKAVGAGEIAEEQLDASVLRILEWKCSMGLL